MRKQLFSFALDEELKEKMKEYQKTRSISLARIIELSLNQFLKEVELKKQEKKNIINNTLPMTEEERIADWEWRKEQVERGHFPKEMALEYPPSYIE
jgi:hypothetical protein